MHCLPSLSVEEMKLSPFLLFHAVSVQDHLSLSLAISKFLFVYAKVKDFRNKTKKENNVNKKIANRVQFLVTVFLVRPKSMNVDQKLKRDFRQYKYCKRFILKC